LARRSKSILDDLTTLPWWTNVILAIVVYLSFKYLIPSIAFQNAILKGIAMALPTYASVVGGILLLVAGISAFNAWRKGELLEQQNDFGTLRKISWQEFEELAIDGTLVQKVLCTLCTNVPLFL